MSFLCLFIPYCPPPHPQLGFPGGSGKNSVKNRPANAGDAGSIAGLGRSPGEGNGNPLQYSCLGNPLNRGAMEGYNPWDCRVAKQQLPQSQLLSESLSPWASSKGLMWETIGFLLLHLKSKGDIVLCRTYRCPV